MKNIFTRMAAVKAATHTVPNALFALCNMMLPIAVMENCKPIGTPIDSKTRARPAWNRRSSGDSARRMGKRRVIYR